MIMSYILERKPSVFLIRKYFKGSVLLNIDEPLNIYNFIGIRINTSFLIIPLSLIFKKKYLIKDKFNLAIAICDTSSYFFDKYYLNNDSFFIFIIKILKLLFQSFLSFILLPFTLILLWMKSLI